MRYEKRHKEAHAFEVEDTSCKLNPSEAKAEENDPQYRNEHQAEPNVHICRSDEIDIVIGLSAVRFIEVRCQSAIPVIISATEHSKEYINDNDDELKDDDSFLESFLHSLTLFCIELTTERRLLYRAEIFESRSQFSSWLLAKLFHKVYLN